MEKKITCTVCPMGCEITVIGEGEHITSAEGFSCARGEKYARAEFVHPVRILTTTVRTTSRETPLLAVRSKEPVPKELVIRCVEALKDVTVSAPVKVHDVICADICGTGIDVVASANL